MINPNATHKRYGTVMRLTRSADGSINTTIRLLDGTELNELGFIYHKSLKRGDLVVVTVGFRIMSDRYGIETVRRVSHKTAEFIKNLDSITYGDIVKLRRSKAA